MHISRHCVAESVKYFFARVECVCKFTSLSLSAVFIGVKIYRLLLQLRLYFCYLLRMLYLQKKKKLIIRKKPFLFSKNSNGTPQKILSPYIYTSNFSHLSLPFPEKFFIPRNVKTFEHARAARPFPRISTKFSLPLFCTRQTEAKRLLRAKSISQVENEMSSKKREMRGRSKQAHR